MASRLARGVLLLIGCTQASVGFAGAVSTIRANPMPSGVSPIRATSGVPSRPHVRPLLAVDVDETLCITDYNSLIWGIGSDDSMPLPGAQATMRRLAESFDVVYVTARSRSLAGKTRSWLEKHGFPPGRIVTSPSLGDFLFQSNFKRKILTRLKSENPNLVAGIGDKAKDAEAYRAAGITPVIVNPWPNQKYHADDNVCRDWPAVSAFFDANWNRLKVMTPFSRVTVRVVQPVTTD